jgi:hypothetical protein
VFVVQWVISCFCDDCTLQSDGFVVNLDDSCYMTCVLQGAGVEASMFDSIRTLGGDLVLFVEVAHCI